MSLFLFRSRWLSFGPNVDITERWLAARSSTLAQLLRLGTFAREVCVDREDREIRIRDRRFLSTTKRTFRFEDLDHVFYRFASLPTSFTFPWVSRDWSLPFLSARQEGETADSLERFEVGLALRGGSEIPLFRFWGEGSNLTGLSGVLGNDSLVDFEGLQADDSRVLAVGLVHFTGAPLNMSASMVTTMSSLMTKECTLCKRRAAPASVCLYCGGPLRDTGLEFEVDR